MQQGATLVIEGGSIASGVVTGGAASQLATAGSAYGQGVFLQGSAQVELEATAAQTLTVTGLIADQTGSDPTAASQGSGGLIIGDASGLYIGTVVLDPTASTGSGAASVNVYTGGTTIDSGTLELDVTGAAGPGAITFAGPSAALQLAAGVTVASTLYGLQVGDSLILSQPIIGFSLASGNVLTIDQQDGTTQTFHLDPSQTFPNEAFGYAGDTLALYGPPAVVDRSASVVERQSVTGAALTGDSTANPQGMLSVTAEATPYQGGSSVGVPASGQASLQGAFGVLTIAANGSYSYAASSEGETVGVQYADSFTVTVADGLGTSSTETLTFTSLGSATGNASANIIIGGSGVAETIEGLGAADLLIAGSAPDTFTYTSASDSPYSTTAVTYDAIDGFRSGTDKIDVSAADGGAVELIRYDTAGSPQTFVYFDRGGSDGYQGVIDVYGVVQPGDVVTTANPIYDYGDTTAGQVLDGSVGHSFLVSGGAAAETLIGGAGDALYGGAGADDFVIPGVSASPESGGFDTLVNFTSGQDTLDLSAAANGAVVLAHENGVTFVEFAPDANGDGGYQGFLVVQDNVLPGDLKLASGATVTSYLYGTSTAGQSETLDGTAGHLIVEAGAGTDTLLGGPSDTLYAGAGADDFVIGSLAASPTSAYDVIGGFKSGTDKLDLSRVDGGHVLIEAFNGDAFIYFDPNASGAYQGVVEVTTAIAASDLIVSSGAQVSAHFGAEMEAYQAVNAHFHV